MINCYCTDLSNKDTINCIICENNSHPSCYSKEINIMKYTFICSLCKLTINNPQIKLSNYFLLPFHLNLKKETKKEINFKNGNNLLKRILIESNSYDHRSDILKSVMNCLEMKLNGENLEAKNNSYFDLNLSKLKKNNKLEISINKNKISKNFQEFLSSFKNLKIICFFMECKDLKNDEIYKILVNYFLNKKNENNNEIENFNKKDVLDILKRKISFPILLTKCKHKIFMCLKRIIDNCFKCHICEFKVYWSDFFFDKKLFEKLKIIYESNFLSFKNNKYIFKKKNQSLKKKDDSKKNNININNFNQYDKNQRSFKNIQFNSSKNITETKFNDNLKKNDLVYHSNRNINERKNLNNKRLEENKSDFIENEKNNFNENQISKNLNENGKIKNFDNEKSRNDNKSKKLQNGKPQNFNNNDKVNNFYNHRKRKPKNYNNRNSKKNRSYCKNSRKFISKNYNNKKSKEFKRSRNSQNSKNYQNFRNSEKSKNFKSSENSKNFRNFSEKQQIPFKILLLDEKLIEKLDNLGEKKIEKIKENPKTKTFFKNFTIDYRPNSEEKKTKKPLKNLFTKEKSNTLDIHKPKIKLKGNLFMNFKKKENLKISNLFQTKSEKLKKQILKDLSSKSKKEKIMDKKFSEILSQKKIHKKTKINFQNFFLPLKNYLNPIYFQNQNSNDFKQNIKNAYKNNSFKDPLDFLYISIIYFYNKNIDNNEKKEFIWIRELCYVILKTLLNENFEVVMNYSFMTLFGLFFSFSGNFGDICFFVFCLYEILIGISVFYLGIHTGEKFSEELLLGNDNLQLCDCSEFVFAAMKMYFEFFSNLLEEEDLYILFFFLLKHVCHFFGIFDDVKIEVLKRRIFDIYKKE